MIEDDRTVAQLQLERADTIIMLRNLCAEYGDNDWNDNLHLSDIIEKHLMRHLLPNDIALREALEPLGKWKTPETFEEWPDNAQVILTVKASHIRRARAALK